MRRPIAGMLLFHCGECATEWSDPCGDILNPSGTHCINEECGALTSPFVRIPKSELEEVLHEIYNNGWK